MRNTLLLLLIVIITASCAHTKLRKELVLFEQTRIVLPEDMFPVGPMHHRPDSAKATFIRYVDSTECTSCFLSAIYRYEEMLDIADSLHNLDFIIIITPAKSQEEYLYDELTTGRYLLPIFYDQYCDFPRLNPDFPTDKRFHSFMINGEGYPVFVGDPTLDNNPRLRLLMTTIFNKL